MTTLTFTTNINCGHCIKSVSGFLADIDGIEWEVNTEDPRKILTVQGENIQANTVIEAVKEAGFNIELMN